MSIAPEYRYDLFISYARDDNSDHWIDELGAGLQKELDQVLGRDVKVLIDRPEFTKELSGDPTARIADSKVFVPVLSPSYLASQWCMTELETALRSPSPTEPTGRIFPIFLSPIDHLSLPAELANIQHVSFWDDKEHSPVPSGSKLWSQQVGQLAVQLGRALETTNGRAAPRVKRSEKNIGPEEPAAQPQKRPPPRVSEVEDRAEPNASPKQGRADAPVSEDKSSERVSAHADDPATIDELGRRPFAEVLAERLDEVWKNQVAAGDPRTNPDRGGGGFMLNIDGPWGSGKTSVLNFLKSALRSPGRPDDQRWVVVEFNAWQQQRVRPPWWTLIREVYTQALGQLDSRSKRQLFVRWWRWRFRADLLPAAIATMLVLLAFLTVLAPSASSTARASQIEVGLKIVLAVLAAGAGVFGFSRTITFGSSRAAQTYTDLRADPLGPVTRLFTTVVSTLRRPLVVFIDDLDRCDGKYVIELLEGIQTLFRRPSVTYVVAADRRWICSSFEQGFDGFKESVGGPGRPLGYLFVDKVFQLSVSIPHLSPDSRRRYWDGLLRDTRRGDPAAHDAERKKAEDSALKAVDGLHTQEALQRKIEEATGDPVREQAVRAAAAKQITRPEAMKATEHRLKPWADLVEHNPRSMKRIVNAVALQQAIHFLEGRQITPETLAQWTILELRWPVLAEFLYANPSKVRFLQNGGKCDDDSVPKHVASLFADSAVLEVAAANGIAGATALSELHLRELTM